MSQVEARRHCPPGLSLGAGGRAIAIAPRPGQGLVRGFARFSSEASRDYRVYGSVMGSDAGACDASIQAKRQPEGRGNIREQ